MKAIVYKQTNKKLLKDWLTLWNKSQYSSTVNSPGWLLASFEAFPEKESRIIAIYEKEKLIAIGAFMKERLFGVPVFSTPGIEFADRSSILIDYKNKKAIRLLFQKIKELGNIQLGYITNEDHEHFKRSFSSAKFIQTDVGPYMTFSDGIYGDLSKRRRVNIINRLKKFEEEVVFESSETEHSRALSRAFEIETESSKNYHGKSIFDKEYARKFYTAFASLLPQNIAVGILYFGEKPVAYCIGFVHKKTFIASQKAHLANFNYYNPGKALVMKLLEYWNDKGFDKFSHGRGNDRFKMTFTKKSDPIYQMFYFQNSVVLIYVSYMLRLRGKVYELVSHHAKIYNFYHNVKKIHFSKIRTSKI
jgi:CelD/BcsL family acetyltransferase involved in cellulose biosynthesis